MSRRTTLALKLMTDEIIVLTLPDGTTIRCTRGTDRDKIAFDLPEEVKVHRAQVPNLFDLVPPEATAGNASAVPHGTRGPRVVVPAPTPAPVAPLPPPSAPPPAPLAAPVPPAPVRSSTGAGDCAVCPGDALPGSLLCGVCAASLPRDIIQDIDAAHGGGPPVWAARTYLSERRRHANLMKVTA